MSQHDLTIDNQGFPAFRADLNNALQALGSTQSGTTAPSPAFANQLWYDTTNNQLKIRNEDNDAWITLLTLDQSADSVSQLAAAIVALSAGSAGTPSLTATGDTNTGLFFPTADTVGIACGGSEAARIILGQISIPATSSAASSLRLYEDTDNGTNYVDLIAAAAITSNRTLTIPDETGTIITTGSSGQSIPKAALPTGSVLQVVNVVYSTLASSTTSTYVDTGLSASITPTSTSSKILVLVDQGGCGKQTNNTRIKLQLLRGASSIVVIDAGIATYTNSNATNFIGSISIAYLDSPSTTSSTTYKTQFASSSNLDGVFVQTDGSASSITLMEIAG